MKANEDKLLENLVATIMKDSTLETPSIDFTAKVMSQIVTTKNSEVYVYKPLLSKYILILVFGCFIILSIYLFIDQEPQTNSWVNYLNFNSVYINYLTSLYDFSRITMYAVVFATLMLFIQISFLKKHFESQFNK